MKDESKEARVSREKMEELTDDAEIRPIQDLRPRPLEYNDTFLVNGFIYRCVNVKSRDRFTIKCLGEASAEALKQ